MGNSPFRQCLYDLKCKTQPDPLDQTTTFTEDPAFDSKIREAKTLIYEEILPGKKEEYWSFTTECGMLSLKKRWKDYKSSGEP